MQLSNLLTIFAAATAVSATTSTVSYDTGYDNGSRALTAVSCSDGSHGLITKYGWKTQKQVKDFPYIGGVAAVAGWNSPNCGTCWELTYNKKTIHVLAIDHADSGFNIALDAMNALTGGQAKKLGRINATTKQVDKKNCGL